MKTYNLLFWEPFTDFSSYAKLICQVQNLKYIDIGQLFGMSYTSDVSKYFDMGLKIVEDNLDDNILIPAYPRFMLGDKKETEEVIDFMTKRKFVLKTVYYIKNIELEKTIRESLEMKGLGEDNEFMYNSAYENAKKNQTQDINLINEMAFENLKVINSDSMISISAKTNIDILEQN